MKVSVAGRDGRFPSKDGATQSFLIESEKGSKILLDMGSGSLSKLWKYVDPCKIDAIFLSHLHFDHFCDICVYFQLLQFNKISPKDVYMPSSPIEYVKLLNVDAFNCRFYEEESSSIQIGDIEIQPVPLVHPVKSYGFRVKCDGKCLVYTADSVECENLIALLKDADVVLADACISESDEREAQAPLPHIKASRLAELTDPKALLLLTHLAENQKIILQETKDKHPNTMLAEYKSYVIGS